MPCTAGAMTRAAESTLRVANCVTRSDRMKSQSNLGRPGPADTSSRSPTGLGQIGTPSVEAARLEAARVEEVRL